MTNYFLKYLKCVVKCISAGNPFRKDGKYCKPQGLLNISCIDRSRKSNNISDTVYVEPL